ncbi:phosphoadenylyl-sulfate reductase [Akkermansiaceae bacterium]|nr:phosphoadenylyl-sulfate reductase [Akkermansiaceae bacterium]
MTPSEVDQLNDYLEGLGTSEILEWCASEFGKELVATSSFQTQSVPLLHLISKHAPNTRVLFLDTGFHFPETLQFKDGLANLFDLNIVELECLLGRESFVGKYGTLHATDPKTCCFLNKVEPLKRALKGAKAWISGIRRDQTAVRANSKIVQKTADGVTKICPMLEWTSEEVRQYLGDNHLPAHPLLNQGYLSIGCAPCTQAASSDDHERAGRWIGSHKVECGLHTDI